MIGREETLARRWLITVGYHRLSAYWLPYEVVVPDGQTRSKRFAPFTECQTLVDIRAFDLQLRLLVMEAI